MTEDPMVAALLREREGYVQRNLSERVAQVDEQLALRGYQPPAETKPAPVMAASRATPPKGRRTRGTEKA